MFRDTGFFDAPVGENIVRRATDEAAAGEDRKSVTSRRNASGTCSIQTIVMRTPHDPPEDRIEKNDSGPPSGEAAWTFVIQQDPRGSQVLSASAKTSCSISSSNLNCLAKTNQSDGRARARVNKLLRLPPRCA